MPFTPESGREKSTSCSFAKMETYITIATLWVFFSLLKPYSTQRILENLTQLACLFHLGYNCFHVLHISQTFPICFFYI